MLTRVLTETVYDQFAAQAERNPGAVAITAPDRSTLVYGQLLAQVETVKDSLNACGIGRNDRVVIVLDDAPAMAAAFMAIASCCTAVPLNPAYGAEEFKFYVSRLNASALVVNGADQSGVKDLARRLGLKIVELVADKTAPAGSFELHGVQHRDSLQTGFAQEDDVALILHTSGTTSAPKIVPLTHRNICAMARNNQVGLELTPADLCLNIMPLFHSTGLVGVVLASLVSGAGVVCPPGFYAPQFFDWLNEFKPTWFTAVPSMHQAILARARTYSESPVKTRLRFLRSSSSALSQQLMTDLEQLFQAPVIESYGMTECGMIACNPLPPRIRKPRSAGVATTIEIKVQDDHGNFLPPGGEGEIVLRGACVMSGYEAEPVNEESFTNGWFRTGDQGSLDDDGYLFITGRLKEIINRGGEKIAPLEIDQALLEHPFVQQAVTFPVPNDLLGEEVAAAVVLSGEVDETELRRFVASKLATFKVPRQILIVAEIPKGSFGKLQRSRLAALLHVEARDQNTAAGDQEYVAPRTHEETVLADIWSRILGREPVGVYDDFFRLGGDSILATRVISQVRKLMDVELSQITIFESPTIARLARTLHASRQHANGISSNPIKPLPRG